MNIKSIKLNSFNNFKNTKINNYSNNAILNNRISFGNSTKTQQDIFIPSNQELIETSEIYKKEIGAQALQKEDILTKAYKTLSYADEILKNSKLVHQQALSMLSSIQGAINECSKFQKVLQYLDNDITLELDEEKISLSQYRPIDDSYNVFEFNRQTMSPKSVLIGYRRNNCSETAKMKYDFDNGDLTSYCSDYWRKEGDIRAKERAEFKKGELDNFSKNYSLICDVAVAGAYFEFKNRHLNKYQTGRNANNDIINAAIEYVFQGSKELKNLSQDVLYRDGERYSSRSADFQFGKIKKITIGENNRAGKNTALKIMIFSPYSQKLKQYYSYATIENDEIQAAYSKSW